MRTVSRKHKLLQWQMIVLVACMLLLFIPSVYTRALIILCLGALIYVSEKQHNMIVPASPGVVFWLGNVLSYVVGGVGLGIVDGSWDAYGMRYLEPVMFYVAVGTSCYIVGMWVAMLVVRWPARRQYFSDLKYSRFSIAVLCFVFFLAAVLLRPSEGSGSSLYENIVIGAVQSIELLPIIILAVYLVYFRINRWVVVALSSSAFVVALQGMLLGYGRNKAMTAALCLLLIWLGLKFWNKSKIAYRTKALIILLPMIVVVFFGIITEYRETVKFDRSLRIGERQAILESSYERAYASDNFMLNSLSKMFRRLTQEHGLELFGLAYENKIGRAGWTTEDFQQMLLVYVPKYFYPDKGKGLGRDIMEDYGFTTRNNIPPTLIADSYRRSGVIGVMIVYLLMGAVATLMANFLYRHWGTVGALLAVYLAVMSLTLYSLDTYSVFKFYAYRVVASGITIYMLLRAAGFVSGKRFRLQQRAESFNGIQRP